jgi:hypothetical protein
VSAVPCHKLSNIKKKAMDYNIIGIDEGQFVSFVANHY